MTGSINQHGEIQAIGGVNEKIEGFFDICARRGLSGDQGVIVPAANRLHLMLNRDVREAVEQGRFRVYPANTVEDVMQLLSGLEPGVADAEGRYPPGSFNFLVQQRVEELQRAARRLGKRLDDDAEAAPAPDQA